MKFALVKFRSLREGSHFRHNGRLLQKMVRNLSRKCNRTVGEPEFVAFQFYDPVVAIPSSKAGEFIENDEKTAESG